MLILNDSSDEEVVVDLSENETKDSTNPNIINDGDTDNDAENFEEPIKSTTAHKSPTKSKRGRKPKNKEVIVENIPKRRGRPRKNLN